MKTATLLLSAFLPLALCCTSIPAPTPELPRTAVMGDGAVEQNLAGKWRGTYATEDHAHDGAIEFEFSAGSKEGTGRIVVTGSGTQLRLLWIRASGEGIAGAVQPYEDPSCSCQVYSTFSGVFDGQAWRGEFRRKAASVVVTGTWSAQRLSAP